jgi:hypothetical protein
MYIVDHQQPQFMKHYLAVFFDSTSCPSTFYLFHLGFSSSLTLIFSTLSPPIMPANSDSTLCNRCRSIFNIYQEPTFLNDQCIPNADNTVMHHEGSSSFQKAVRDNCFICSTLNAENASATRAQLVKIGEGEYTVAIYTTAEDQLGRVTYFAVTKSRSCSSILMMLYR